MTWKQIIKKYSGRTAILYDIYRFGLIETIYQEKHIRRALKKAEEQGIIEVTRPEGKKTGFPNTRGKRISIKFLEV